MVFCLPFRDVIGVIAAERVLVEDTSVAAVDDARVIVDASHQTGASVWSGHRVARERGELARQRVGWKTGHVGAPESDHFCSIQSMPTLATLIYSINGIGGIVIE